MSAFAAAGLGTGSWLVDGRGAVEVAGIEDETWERRS